MKAVWKGSISFGLVSIPIGLYTSSSGKEYSFNMLHSEDGGRIRYKKICEKCGEEISKEDIVKGYQISKNEYVVLTDDDFAKIPLSSVKNIDIKYFFEPSELNILYYSNFYFLGPLEGGEKAYAILIEAMNSTGTMGIGKVTLRNKEYLVALKSIDGGLLLAQLRYIDEVKNPEDVPGWNPKVEFSDEELELAERLLLAMKKSLRIEEFRDNYKEALSRLIEAKLSGKEIVVSEEIKEAGTLVDALKSSLEAVKSK